MYLLHGYSEDENIWVGKGRVGATIDRLIANGDVPPILIVMPDSGNSGYVDAKEKYESAFINDLLPEIEQRFRTPHINRSGGTGYRRGFNGRVRVASIYSQIPGKIQCRDVDESCHLRSGTASAEQREEAGSFRGRV